MAKLSQDNEKLVHCSNCNAEYDEALEVCPYCGAENKNRVIKEQFDYLKNIHDKTEHAEEQIISERAEKGSRRVSKVAKIAVAAAIAIAFLTFVIYAGMSAFSAVKREKMLATLEEQYKADDYKAMQRTMENMKAYDFYSSTQKYRNLLYVYRDIENAKQSVKSAIKNAGDVIEPGNYKETDKEWFARDIMACYVPLFELKEYEDEGFRYREQQGVEYLRNDIRTFMKDNLLMSDEEIDEGLEMYLEMDVDTYYDYDSNYLKPMAEVILDRILID